MGKINDSPGTSNNIFQIGIGASGNKTLRFKNGSRGDLVWTPSATRTITIPDASGTVQLSGDGSVISPEGLTLSYFNTILLYINAGRAVISAAGNRAIAVLASNLLKSLSGAWVAGGSGAGGKFAGTLAANQTWHVFVIRNTTTGVIDAGFDLSVTGANIPSGWTGRLIGSIMTDGANAIRPFVQSGDRFDWVDYVLSFNGTTSTSTANLVTLAVPTGLAVIAIGRFYLDSTASFLYASAPAVNADIFITTTSTTTSFEIPTNTSAQIKYYASIAATSSIAVRGFYHPRGAY